MKKALSLLLLVSGAALADDAAVLKCRALSEAASRLACYDAMPVATAPAAAAPNAGAVRTEAVQPEAKFGLAKAAPAPAKEKSPSKIRSTVTGALDGWSPGTRIALANGQVWRVTEGEAVLPRLNNPQVEISRGMFSSYLLQIDGHANTARVERVQ